MVQDARFFDEILPEGWRFLQKPEGPDLAHPPGTIHNFA